MERFPNPVQTHFYRSGLRRPHTCDENLSGLAFHRLIGVRVIRGMSQPMVSVFRTLKEILRNL
jgi:hypothetical protein